MTNILVSDFVTVLLIFLRIVAVMFSAPVFSNNSFPNLSKVFISVVIAYILFFTVKDFKFDFDKGIIWLGLLAFKELITGFVIGFSLNFIFYGISYAGMLIGIDTGFSMASIFDPSQESENNLIGQLLYFSALMIFLIINGHHYIIKSLAVSFNLIPLGKFTINNSVLQLMIKYSSGIFIIAVKVSAPIIVSFFLINVALGVISRVIPQMQVFFVIQPLQIALGLFLISASASIIVFIIKNLLLNFENSLYDLIKAMV